MIPRKYIPARALVCLALFASLFFAPIPALAAPLMQDDDPVAQCDKGVQLFLNGKPSEALPFLEAGFANRDQGNFPNLSDLGLCARALGMVQESMSKFSQAIETHEVELNLFRQAKDKGNEGLTLRSIGSIYHVQGKYTDALPYYEESLEIWRELNSVARESTLLNDIGGLYKDMDKYSLALDSLEQALKIQQEVKDKQSIGNITNNIGGVLFALNQYDEALDYFKQALVIRREIGDKKGEGATLSNIGAFYNEQKQPSLALEYYRQALEIRRETNDKRGEGITLTNIGNIYRNSWQYAQAIEYYQQALILCQENDDKPNESKVMDNIAGIYSEFGQYTKALSFYQKELLIIEELDDRSSKGSVLNKIGLVYEKMGVYTPALFYFQQALAIARELADLNMEGIVLSNIGLVYHDLDQYRQSEEYLLEALAIHLKVNGQISEGKTLLTLGSLYYRMGEEDISFEYFQQALAISKKNSDRKNEAYILRNLGVIYEDTAQFDKAFEYFNEALAIYNEIDSRSEEGLLISDIGTIYLNQGKYDQALEYLQSALLLQQEMGNQENKVITTINIGKTYVLQGETVKASEFYDTALTIVDTLRTTAGPDFARASYISQYAFLYDEVVELNIKLNQPEKAFLTSERGRSRAFLDSMATGYIELSDNQSNELYIQEQEAFSVLQTARAGLGQAKVQNPSDEKLIANLESQVVQTEKDHQAALDSIAARDGQLQQLIPGRSKVLEVPQAQALLDAQTTLLSFWILDDQTLVFVLTPKTFNVISLPITQKDLYTQIQAFRAFSNTDIAYPESAVTLYKVLIEPLKSELNTPNLIIIPQGELHYLPFAALTDGSQYLVDQYNISYLPSVSAFPFIRENIQANGGDTLLIGDPATGNAKLAPLPFAEKEVLGIADLYGVNPFIGSVATESKVKEKASQAGILHLAAHGSYNMVAPLYSSITLAPDGQNDGLLEVHEIYGLDLHKTNLVVLSACETQLGELSSGDELVGLTRAFFFAGTPTVVASLWSVDDEATSMLMEQFYTHVYAGLGKAAALRQAQIAVRAKYPNPYYWAGFVLSGDGGKISDFNPMDLSFINSTPTYILLAICCFGLAVLLVAVGGFFWVRQRKRNPIG